VSEGKGEGMWVEGLAPSPVAGCPLGPGRWGQVHAPKLRAPARRSMYLQKRKEKNQVASVSFDILDRAVAVGKRFRGKSHDQQRLSQRIVIAKSS